VHPVDGAMTWLATRRQGLMQALKGLTRQPLVTLLAVLVATLAILLPLALATLALPLLPLSQRLAAPAQAVVFVTAGATSAEVAALRAKLAAQAYVVEATHVPRDAALADLTRRAPGGALPDLRSNPLPDSIVVSFARGTSADAADAAVTAMRKLPKVDAVQFDGAWYRRWTALAAFGGPTAAVLATALLLLAMGAVTAAARLPVPTRSDELRLLRLVGATAAFRRRPFAYAGALIGVAAGLLAGATVAGGLAALGPEVAAMQASGLDFAWTLPWQWIAGAGGVAGLTGAVAGALAGRRADLDAMP
jgi:cell division transport system permease protein